MRGRALARLRREQFDVLVIGGGVNGAGIARDLALRARGSLRIALVEQRHFASGTSGRNSQLLHGGLRYLEGLHFGLVREALHERVTLARIAPHLVDPIPFLIPFYGWFPRRYYGAGLWFYDLLAGASSIGRRRFLSRAATLLEEPGLAASGLHSSGIYWDCRVNAARLVLENIFEAIANGAVVANYVRAGAPDSITGGGCPVEATDVFTGERFRICARKIVDARGPWDDGGGVRLVRGSHLVLPRVASGAHAIAHFHSDGRIIFVIPWGPDDSLSLVGTTDVDHSDGPDRVAIGGDEVRYLQGILRGLFPGASIGEPIAAYSSLRPLADSGGSATSASRAHRIFWDADVLRVTGGKYTTYRAMSQEAVDRIAPELRGKCTTASTPLNGNSARAVEDLRARAGSLADRYGVETRAVESLIRTHGLSAENVLGWLPEAGSLDGAIMRHAIEQEMALRLPDLLFVSTYWGFERRADWLAMARAMGGLLGWDDRRMEEEAELAARIAALPAG